MRALGANTQSVRGRSRDETRAHILAAAERVFAESGLEGARTEAIAASAGVNKALLYYYFKSKERLYQAVLEGHLKEFHRRADQALSQGGSAQTTVLRYVSTHFDFISARPFYPRLIQRLVMSGGPALPRLVKAHLLPLYRKLGAIIQRGVHAGELRPVDGQHTVLSLVALTVFYFSAAPVMKAVTRVDPYSGANLKRRKAEVLDFIRHGLFRPAGGPDR